MLFYFLRNAGFNLIGVWEYEISCCKVNKNDVSVYNRTSMFLMILLCSKINVTIFRPAHWIYLHMLKALSNSCIHRALGNGMARATVWNGYFYPNFRRSVPEDAHSHTCPPVQASRDIWEGMGWHLSRWTRWILVFIFSAQTRITAAYGRMRTYAARSHMCLKQQMALLNKIETKAEAISAPAGPLLKTERRA